MVQQKQIAMQNLGTNEKVTIYYNKVTIGDRSSGHIVHIGCQSVDVPWRQATEYAEMKISSKEWDKYLIPALNSLETTYEDQAPQDEEKVSYIECKCGNKEEVTGGPEELNEFIWETANYYVCTQCHNEVQFNPEEQC